MKEMDSMRMPKISKINTLLTGLMMMVILLCCSSQTQAAQQGDYTYTVTDGKATITKYNGTGGAVAIPNTLGGYPVTRIGGYVAGDAFYNCTNLTSISIPQTVTRIECNAFFRCTNLTSISIPQGLTSIGGCAFMECKSLTSISLPQTVTSIGEGVFYDCSGLTSINLPQGLTNIPDEMFQECTSLTNISIPQGVTSIGLQAFIGCASLTSISIPQGVTSISEGAFQNCTGLTSMSIPVGVTSIGTQAFLHCTGLTSINIPRAVISIGRDAFTFCTSLKTIIFNSATTTIDEYTLYSNEGVIPTQATIIGYSGSTAQAYAKKYNRSFQLIDYNAAGVANNGGLATGIILSSSSLIFNDGNPQTLVAKVYPANTTDKSIKWTSSNNAIATVCNGLVTPISAGTAIITAMPAYGTGVAQCTVEVTYVDYSLPANKEKDVLRKIALATLANNDQLVDTKWVGKNVKYVIDNNGTNANETMFIVSNNIVTWKDLYLNKDYMVNIGAYKILDTSRSIVCYNSHMDAVAFEDINGDIIIAYAGTSHADNDADTTEASWPMLRNGDITQQFYDAKSFYESILGRYNNGNNNNGRVSLIGHSLGGALATYVSIMEGGVKADCFNDGGGHIILNTFRENPEAIESFSGANTTGYISYLNTDVDPYVLNWNGIKPSTMGFNNWVTQFKDRRNHYEYGTNNYIYPPNDYWHHELASILAYDNVTDDFSLYYERDHTIVSGLEIENLTLGTNRGDRLNAVNIYGDNVIYTGDANGGTDYVYGGWCNDTIVASGTGSKQLYGRGGSDTYIIDIDKIDSKITIDDPSGWNDKIILKSVSNVNNYSIQENTDYYYIDFGNNKSIYVKKTREWLQHKIKLQDTYGHSRDFTVSFPLGLFIQSSAKLWASIDDSVIFSSLSLSSKSKSLLTSEVSQTDDTLNSIAINTTAAKLSYTVGDTLDISGLVVTGTYDNGTTADLTVTADNITGFDSSTINPAEMLTVTVGGQTATYTISIAAATSTATLKSMRLTGVVDVKVYDQQGVLLGEYDNIGNDVQTADYGYFYPVNTDDQQFMDIDLINGNYILKVTSAGTVDFSIYDPDASETMSYEKTGIDLSDGTVLVINTDFLSAENKFALEKDQTITPMTATEYVSTQQVNIDKSQINLKTGCGTTAVATVSPANVVSGAVAWSVIQPNDNTVVAGITTNEDGSVTVTGFAAGSATLRATAQDGSGIYCEIPITVTQDNAPSYSVVDADGAAYSSGDWTQTSQVTVTAVMPDGYDQMYISDGNTCVLENSITITDGGQHKIAVYAKNDTTGEITATANIQVNIDQSAPLISGVADGGEYYIDRLIQVTDDGLIASVMENSTISFTADEIANGKWFTVAGSYTITATDSSGRETQLSFVIKLMPDIDSLAVSDLPTVQAVREEFESVKYDLPSDRMDTLEQNISSLEADLVSLCTLKSIAIITPADKLNYTVGDTLDITGLVVTGTFSDATTGELEVIADNVTGFNSSAPAASQTLTITFGGQTTTYNVSVAVAKDTDATLSDLQVDGTSVTGFAPTTLRYDLVLAAGTTTVPTVTATVTDTSKASAAIIQATSLPGAATVVVTAEDGTTIQTYTINFTVATQTARLTFSPPSGSSITASTPITISAAPELSETEAIYWNTTGAQLTTDDSPYQAEFNLPTPETVYAAVYDSSAGLWSDQFSATYANAPTAVPVTSITVTGAGNATVLEDGLTLQMIAAVLPADATNQSITWSAATLAGGAATIDASTGLLTATGIGAVTVKATANDGSGVSGTEQITVTIPAAATLESIAITNPATKLSYTVGDLLDITGLTVTGTYSDNSTKVEPITASEVTSFNSSAPAASQTLTITYGGQTTTYTVSIVASASNITYGDVNVDGKINSGDATLVLRSYAKLTTLTCAQLAAADVNGDGKVNSGDATLILRYYAKLISSFPVQQ